MYLSLKKQNKTGGLKKKKGAGGAGTLNMIFRVNIFPNQFPLLVSSYFKISCIS